MRKHTGDDLIGTAEACRILNRDKATLSRWVGLGIIAPALKLPGKNGPYLFHRHEIDTLAKQKTTHS